MLRRIRPTHVIDGALDGLDGQPWVCDCRSWDIPSTIAALVRNAPAGLVAISLRPYGARMIAAAERAARRRGVRIIWLPIGRAIRD
jgi:orotidine-5'-phosphate decarboxylase